MSKGYRYHNQRVSFESNQENNIYKLNKVRYGLKQAARTWYNKISDTLKNVNLNERKIYSCFFTQKMNNKARRRHFNCSKRCNYRGNNRSSLNKEYELKSLGDIGTTASYNLNISGKIRPILNTYAFVD